MSEAIAREGAKDSETFVNETFFHILCRKPSKAELDECLKFLDEVPNRARLVQALLNHNDFLMIR